METDSIASIARSLPPIPSRRTALRLLAGLGLLGTGGVLGRAEVEAKERQEQGQEGQRQEAQEG
jgi:hypothetical protein